MAEMKSPPVGAVYEHVNTGDRAKVVEHMFERHPDDSDAEERPQTPFVVEDADGNRTGYEHPAQFYDTYVRV